MQLMHTAHVPAGAGPFPTVVALHGWGASAHDLLGLAPFLLGGDALVLCPQGPVELEIGPGMPGYGWFPISAGGPLDVGAFGRATELLHGFLDQAERQYPVERRKVVLLGFSQGGVMAYELALREPARFAGLAALSSWLPDPLARAIPPLPEHKGLPVFVCHGTEDPMIPIERGRESREALLRLGVNLAYREYAMGHEIRPEALRDLVEWLHGKVVSPIQLA
jgi:phospholipase/carboxylesterase